MERAWRPHVALALIGLTGVPDHLSTHDVRKRRAAFQFVEESGGQAHAVNIGLAPPEVQTASETFRTITGGNTLDRDDISRRSEVGHVIAAAPHFPHGLIGSAHRVIETRAHKLKLARAF